MIPPIDPDDDPPIDIIDFIAPIIAIALMFGCVLVYILVVMR